MTTKQNADPVLAKLIRAAEDPDIFLRDQYPTENPPPSLTPGWNTLSVTDLVKGMFLVTAAEQLPTFDDEEDHPDLTDDDLDTSVPGLNDRILEAVTSNLISDDLFVALRTETQNIAQRLVQNMTPQERTALLHCAKSKLSSQ